MKHIEIRFFALQQRREQKRLEFEKIGTDDNESDMLTKTISTEKLEKFSRQIGLIGPGHRPSPETGRPKRVGREKRGLSQQGGE